MPPSVSSKRDGPLEQFLGLRRVQACLSPADAGGQRAGIRRRRRVALWKPARPAAGRVAAGSLRALQRARQWLPFEAHTLVASARVLFADPPWPDFLFNHGPFHSEEGCADGRALRASPKPVRLVHCYRLLAGFGGGHNAVFF